MTPSTYFSSDYASARALFLENCAHLDLPVKSRQHPTVKGPDGELLFMDVARIGPAIGDAKGVMFVTSATHGTEGLTGSGVQVALLNDYRNKGLPDDIAVVLVHAVNPYGFAHLCRTNEDNIDLNRNFIDFSIAPLANPDYEIIHPWILPDDWHSDGRKKADKALASFIEENGERRLQAILLQGQYTRPDGLFYGGKAPSWSNRQWIEIVKTEGAGAKHLAIVDVHTGIGPTGYGEPIYVGTESGFACARNWYGDDVTNAGKGKSHASDFNGPMVCALWTEHPKALHTAIVLEFGTCPLTQVLAALRADNWLRHNPVAGAALQSDIKKNLRDALYVDDDNWRQQILDRSRELIERGIAGLHNSCSV